MLIATNTYDAFKLKGVYYFNYKNTGFDVYQTKSVFPITVILDDKLKPVRSGTLITPRNENYQLWQTLLAVADYWGETIGLTDAKTCREPVYIPFYNTEGNYELKINPLINENNNGLTINVCALSTLNKSFGETIINLTRSRTIDKNTKTYLLPYHCTLLLNTLRFNDACEGLPYENVNNDEKQFFRVPLQPLFDGYEYVKDNIWYLLSHQLCHCLGFGTMWYVRNYKGKLIRSFIVGANDTSANTYRTNRLNLFYTTQSQNVNRDAQSDLAVFLGDDINITRVGDAKYIEPYNNESFKGGFTSRAVASFNNCFNTNVSAIPLESNGKEDTIGCHWDEGYTYNVDNKMFVGSSRKYYGMPIQGVSNDLMSTSLNTFKPSPVSDVTLGAMHDLGYAVNFSNSEQVKPLTYTLNCTNINSLQVTVNADNVNFIKILAYNPYNTFIPGQIQEYNRDWLNDPACNFTDVDINDQSGQRYTSDPRNTPLICRRGFTYTFICNGTITKQDSKLAPIIAYNIKLSRDNTRIFDIVDENDERVSQTMILRDGVCIITLTLRPRDIATETTVFWLRVGVKNDKAKLNYLKYSKDKQNFTFTNVVPIYIYG